MVGIYGTSENGDMVIASTWGQMGKINPGANPVGRPTVPPTPTWTQQLEGQVNYALEEVRKTAPMAQQAERNAAAAAASAEQAAGDAASASSAVVQTTEARDTAIQAMKIVQTFANSAESSATNARKAASLAGEKAAAAGFARDAAAGLAETAAADAISAKAEADRAASAAALSMGHGITGAEKGDLMQITQVDDRGIPTAVRPVTMQELMGTPVLIEKIILRRDEKVNRDVEPDGVKYKFRCVYLKVHVPKGKYGWIYGFRVHLHGVPSWSALVTADLGNQTAENGTFMVASLTAESGTWKLRTGTNSGEWNPIVLTGLPYEQEYTLTTEAYDYIAELESVGILPSGTEIEIKAVRA